MTRDALRQLDERCVSRRAGLLVTKAGLVQAWQGRPHLPTVGAFEERPSTAFAVGQDFQRAVRGGVLLYPLPGLVLQVAILRLGHGLHHLPGFLVAVEQPQPGVLLGRM